MIKPRCFCLLAILLSVYTSTLAQENWLPTTAPITGRYEDVYFISPDTGWAITFGGPVIKTTDGGHTWQTIYTNPLGLPYRDIGFLNSQIGFIGLLQESVVSGNQVHLLKTTNGGSSWSPVSLPGPTTAGICGLRVINDSTIYGCGRYFGPAAFYKSTNRGVSWTYKNMSALAGGLIDIYFLNADTGFVVGTKGGFSNTNFFDSCAVVLYTTDGGDNWQTVGRSSRNGEGCWKISFPSRNIGYISIEADRRTTNYQQYFLKTTNGGLTWNEMPLTTNGYFHAQGMGFVNNSIGWVSGNYYDNGSGPNGYSTTNGGLTWSNASWCVHGNRFRFFGDTIGYAAGETIYRYKKNACNLPVSNLNVGFCPNDTVLVGNQKIYTVGTSYVWLQNDAGCDSVIKVTAVANPAFNMATTVGICPGSNYNFHGRILNTTGYYYDTLQSVHGCDSVRGLALTVSDPIYEYKGMRICTGDSILHNGHYYKYPDTFYDTLTAIGGCDSIVRTSITGLYPVTPTMQISRVICSGDSFLFNNIYRKSTGIYSDTLADANGCHYFSKCTLTVNPPLQSTVQASICTGEAFYIGQTPITQPGHYLDTISNSFGCDSIVNLTLTEDTFPPVFAGNFPATVCYNEDAIPLTNGTPAGGVFTVNNIPDSLFRPSVLGVGTHTIVYKYSTTQCIGYDTVLVTISFCNSIYTIENKHYIKLYPVPATSLLNIETTYTINQLLKYEVYDIAGRSICSLTSNKNLLQLDISGFPQGVYLLSISNSELKFNTRFVKQ